MNMLINGAFVPSSTGTVMEVTDPYTYAVLDSVPAASKEDADRAVSAARDAYPLWSRTPVYERAKLARRFRELVEAEREELAVSLSRESGKKIAQSRIEVNNILLSWELFIEKDIPYTFEAYSAHLEEVRRMAEDNPRLTLELNPSPAFHNLTFTVFGDKAVIVSKENSPAIHFVIHHKLMVQAFSNFIPPIFEN